MNRRSTLLLCLIGCVFGSAVAHSAAQDAPRAKRVLLIGQGPDGHPVSTHEYRAGVGLLGKTLGRVKGVQTIVVSADGEWADGPELLDAADAVVLFVSEGAKWIQDDAKRFVAFQELGKRGGGLTCLHWGMGTKDAKNIAGFVDLFGGCHGGPDRRYKVVEVALELGKHPIMAGVKPITLNEEFYFKLKQPSDTTDLTPLVRVNIEDADHTVGWAWTRPANSGGGRSFGFSGLHFHENWKQESYRRMMTQGVMWTVGVAIPDGGADVSIGEKDFVLPVAKAPATKE